MTSTEQPIAEARVGAFDYDIGWWAAALRAGKVVVDIDECRLPSRHGHHRYAILGPGGVQQLSIPLVRSTCGWSTPLCEVAISEHANWRRVHWGALYSAYGQTPYFDYVADDLQRVVHGGQSLLIDYNRQMQQLIVDFMQLPVTFDYGHGKSDAATRLAVEDVHDVPYHQLWSDRHGFQPRLSILDLMMNEGPEGIFTLYKMTQGE